MNTSDLGFYRHQGHLTVNGVFGPDEMDAVTRDIEQWGESFLAELPPENRAWYLDAGCDHILGQGTHYAGPMEFTTGADGKVRFENIFESLSTFSS